MTGAELGNPRDIQSIEIVSAGNTKTYKITLSSPKDYRIAYKFDDPDGKQFANALWIQIKH
jgi:hypothetical protein